MLVFSLVELSEPIAEILFHVFVIIISAALLLFARRRAGVRFREITMILAALAIALAVINVINVISS
jgi:hypothetical protein